MSSKMSFLQFCFISEDLFIYLKDSFIERQEEIFISWFTPQNTAMAKTGQSQSQELHLCLLHGWPKFLTIFFLLLLC